MTYSVEKNIYVKNSSKTRIYKVQSFDAYEKTEILHLNLTLVCGLKMDDKWYPATSFPEDEQTDFVSQFFLTESAIEALESNDFFIVDTLPEFC